MTMPMKSLETMQKVLELLATDPAKAADLIEDLGNQMHQQAARIREKLRAGHPQRIPGGMHDVVKMNVVGPDGVVRFSVDTSRN